MKYAKIPCAECPWRRDVPPGTFPPKRFQFFAPCSYDTARQIFACHMRKEGEEFACAGFLLQSAAHNLSVRLAKCRQMIEVSSPYPLYGTYREMAIANGVRPNDAALAYCQDDS